MTMNALTTSQPRLPYPGERTGCTPAQWRVLTDAIFPSAKSAASIVLALQYCAARKLDVFKRPVHVVPMWNSALRQEVETIWPGINELQVTAARTGQWAGMDHPEWGPEITRTFRGQDKDKRANEVTLNYPEWCSVTVYRMIAGQKCGFAEPVYWMESYAKSSKWSEVPNAMWQQRVRGQLHKNAKAASLRAAFPEEAGNDYTAEEMEGKETDGGVVIEAEPIPEVVVVTNPGSGYPMPPLPTFIERVEAAVAKADNATKLLGLMRKVIPQTETMDDLAAVWGLPAVRALWENGPSLIRLDLQELRKEAVDRLSPKMDESDVVSNMMDNYDSGAVPEGPPEHDEEDFPGDRLG